MLSIIVVMIFSAIIGCSVWYLYLMERTQMPKRTDRSALYIIALMLAGAAVHITAAFCYYGHEADMGCFIGWANDVYNEGFAAFYSLKGLHDYPPGYVYVLYILGFLKNIFHIGGAGLQLLIKLPAIAATLVTGAFVYKAASKKFDFGVAAVFASLLIFNPAVILDDALWGQVDTVLALFCVLTVYLAAEGKLILSFFAFAAAFLIKPQALFFSPILIFAVIEDVWLDKDFSLKKLIKYIAAALSAIAVVLVMFMPFGANPIEGIRTVINQYITTMGSYKYMSVNAFNIYAAMGKNWAELNTISSVFGYLMIAVVTAYSAYVFFKGKSKERYYIIAALLCFGVYMTSVKMHERYAFGAVIMLLFALIEKPSSRKFNIYTLVSLSQFFNMAWILFVYSKDINYYFRSPVVAVASIINIAIFAFFVWIIQKECIEGKELKKNVYKTAETHDKTVDTKNVRLAVTSSKVKITGKDIIIMVVITAVYAGIALYNLGNSYAPQTETVISDNAVTVDLGEEKNVFKTQFYLGARELSEERPLVFTFLDDNENEVLEDYVDSGSVFAMTERETEVKARYVVISAPGESKKSDPTDKLYLREVCFLDAEDNIITPINSDDENVLPLFDESSMMAHTKSFMAQTYFDEIYHARTAYEFIHHMSVYEWTHPPLGKIFIGIGILVFGMVPFGWRIVGTLFGIFMVPIIYLFAKKMFRHAFFAAVVCLLFTFDFMHFTQTRIATIDVYVTFFIILMYYYMYKYYNMSFYDTPLKKTLIPLGMSGLFFGFALASKWTGLYAGAGLALLFFITLWRRYSEYRYAILHPTESTDGIEHEHIKKSFKKNTYTTILFCVVMFIIVPALIYTLSYVPYLKTPSGHGLKTIISNAQSMFTYHSKTVVSSTHPYSSHWYEWPIMYRPIYYFSNTLDNGLKQGISAFGNPAVWWLGIGAVAYMAALTIVIPLKKRNYMGINKYVFAGLYAALFALCCIFAYVAGIGNERLERLFPCVLLYSAVIVSVFVLVLTFDETIKQTSNSTALFILVGYLAELMPWMLVTRTTYIYHYFPCVPFVVLAIGYSIKTFYDNARHKKAVMTAAVAYTAAALILFAMFYPVLSGYPCEESYVDTWLRWFGSWVLVS
jgi:dolichyl-phosphate-mannose-protein mannosyltransferase